MKRNVASQTSVPNSKCRSSDVDCSSPYPDSPPRNGVSTAAFYCRETARQPGSYGTVIVPWSERGVVSVVAVSQMLQKHSERTVKSPLLSSLLKEVDGPPSFIIRSSLSSNSNTQRNTIQNSVKSPPLKLGPLSHIRSSLSCISCTTPVGSTNSQRTVCCEYLQYRSPAVRATTSRGIVSQTLKLYLSNAFKHFRFAISIVSFRRRR